MGRLFYWLYIFGGCMVTLRKEQKEAIMALKSGNILCGGVGSGKTRTALGYYYKVCKGKLPMKHNTFEAFKNPKDLYVITTAMKRDTGDWYDEAASFLIFDDPSLNPCGVKMTVDSWNNISKYTKVKDAVFIFDEDRVVGYGTWSKSFIKIAKQNQWILLSATPGDNWGDYMSVFIANGFYRNKSEFEARHAVYSRFTKFPMIERYVDIDILEKYRDSILVTMSTDRSTKRHVIRFIAEYDKKRYKKIFEDRWNIFTDEPVKNISELCATMRKVLNSDPSRMKYVNMITKEKPKVIIFYNYDFELDILLNGEYEDGTVIAQWNGHTHDPIPDTSRWVYLVQYTAGAEGWNCITTDTIIFYSQNYSYKIMEQSMGRIDRMNTPYVDLYYYVISSHASIDLAINRALSKKKKFNQSAFVNKKIGRK